MWPLMLLVVVGRASGL